MSNYRLTSNESGLSPQPAAAPPLPPLMILKENVNGETSNDYSPTIEIINFHVAVPHWMQLPHFQYRRILHEYFQHFHVYHPTFLPRGSTLAACANLIAATIGIGTLAMPYAAHSCGFTLFFIFSCLTYFFTVWSNYVWCCLVDVAQLHSPEMLTRTILGSRRAEVVIECVLVFSCFGGAISYNVVAGDIAQSLGLALGLASASSGVFRILAQVVLFSILLQPLALIKTFSALKFASAVGVISITLVVSFIALEGATFGSTDNVNFIPASNGRISSTPGESLRAVIAGIPLLFFGFTNQVNGIEMYSEIKQRTPISFARISMFSVGFVFVAFVAVGWFGLSLFGGGTIQGNVLQNFQLQRDNNGGGVAGNIFSVVALVAILFKVVLAFPLFMFPLREALLHLVGVEDVRTVSNTTHVCITVGIASSTLVCAVFVPGILLLFGLSGSISAALFGFILPAWLAFKDPRYWSRLKPIRTDSGSALCDGTATSPSAVRSNDGDACSSISSLIIVHRCVNAAMLAIGLFVAVLGTAVTLAAN